MFLLLFFSWSGIVLTPQASKDTHLTFNKPTNTNTSFLGFSKTVVCGLFFVCFVFFLRCFNNKQVKVLAWKSAQKWFKQFQQTVQSYIKGMVFDGGGGGEGRRGLMIVEWSLARKSMALSFCIYSYMSLDCSTLGVWNHISFCLVGLKSFTTLQNWYI